MLQINNRDPRPIYEQVKDGMRRLIITGAIGADEKLPSVRELASSLAINPNTIQRAYRELESEGYIYTVPGKGAFASAVEQTKDVYLSSLYESFDAAVKELLSVGEQPSDLTERIGQIYRRECESE